MFHEKGTDRSRFKGVREKALRKSEVNNVGDGKQERIKTRLDLKSWDDIEGARGMRRSKNSSPDFISGCRRER